MEAAQSRGAYSDKSQRSKVTLKSGKGGAFESKLAVDVYNERCMLLADNCNLMPCAIVYTHGGLILHTDGAITRTHRDHVCVGHIGTIDSDSKVDVAGS